jgi:hypothetical protein
MFDTFQELLEDLGHQGFCGTPYPYDRRPYGALAVELDRKDGNPLRLGAMMMQEATTGRSAMDADDLDAILETAQYDTSSRALIIFWPEIRYGERS